jgi:hypothetical protein
MWEYQPSLTTLPAAATPVFSLKTVTYSKGGPLEISNGMANAQIYYTTDGTIPTSSSTLYTRPITLSSSVTINAIATAPGYRDSAVASAYYGFEQTPAAPTFSPASGTYASAQNVTIADATPGAYIYYTTDGTTPVPSSPVYSAPIIVSSSETINALAVLFGDSVTDGITDTTRGATVGPDASVRYTISLPQAATPTFSVASGTYDSPQTVSISDGSTGATIYYTTNGIAPTTSSTVYTAPITISTTETLEAIAGGGNYADSAVAAATYTITNTPPDFSITVSPISMTVTAGQSGTTTISVTPSNGFSSAVSFSCSGVPAGASCSFSPSTVTPSGAVVTTRMTITTSNTSAALLRNAGAWVRGSTLAAAVLFLGWSKRRRLPTLLLVIATVNGLSMLNGCGVGGSSGGGTTSQPSVFTITVTATSGALKHSTTLSLTVN